MKYKQTGRGYVCSASRDTGRKVTPGGKSLIRESSFALRIAGKQGPLAFEARGRDTPHSPATRETDTSTSHFVYST